MKDFTQAELEASRPDLNAGQALDFVLKRLYADRQHVVTDEIARGLTFEELIGALLLARDTIEQASGADS